jgi:hypothetical protein
MQSIPQNFETEKRYQLEKFEGHYLANKIFWINISVLSEHLEKSGPSNAEYFYGGST